MIDWTNSRVAWMSSQYIDSYTPVEPAYLIGDADTDGEVSILDATAIQLHIADIQHISDLGLLAADADRDGDVSVLDATQIQLYIAGIIDEL